MNLLARILTIALATTMSGTPYLAAAEQGEKELPRGENSTAVEQARFLVLLPERIDVEWFWYYYTDEAQHIVQSAVEKSLVRAGFDLRSFPPPSPRGLTIDSQKLRPGRIRYRPPG